MWDFIPYVPGRMGDGRDAATFRTTPVVVRNLCLPVFILILSAVIPVVKSLVPSRVLTDKIGVDGGTSLEPDALREW